jgi:hypothetical protein
MTRIEFLQELKEWSDTAQKHFNAQVQTLADVTDCVYADPSLRRLQQHRDIKVAADQIYNLLMRGESYDFVLRHCQQKAVDAFRAGNKAMGETWWDWQHNPVLASEEVKENDND